MRYIHTVRPVMTVATGGCVELRLAEPTATAGLFVAAGWGAAVARAHEHR